MLLASINEAIDLATMSNDDDAKFGAGGLLRRQARVAAARRALSVLKQHRALLSLPDIIDEQTALQEWDGMAHNVASARMAIGQKVRKKQSGARAPLR